MAIGTPRSLGTASGKGVTSLSITGVTVAAGQPIFVAYICDINVSATVSDGVNSYQNPSPYTGNINISGFGSYIGTYTNNSGSVYLQADLSCGALSGATITVTHSTANLYAMSVFTFDGGVINPFNIVGISYNTTTSATPLNTITGLNSSNTCTYINILGTNGPSGDTFTQAVGNSSFPVRVGTSGQGATSNYTLAGGIITSASTGNSYNPTLSNSRNWTCMTLVVSDNYGVAGFSSGRYWVGGSGTWTNTSLTSANVHWSYSSGGVGGAFAPIHGDGMGVVIDANSGTPTIIYDHTIYGVTPNFYPNYTDCTFDIATTNIASFSFVGAVLSSTVTFNASNISGIDIMFQNGITSSATINLPVRFYGSCYLNSDFITNNKITQTNGRANLNNHNVTCSTIAFNGTGVLNANNITVTGTGTVVSSNSAAIVGGTIILSDTSTTARTFYGGGTFNNLVIGGTTGTSTLTITGSSSFNTISSTKTVAHTILFTAGTTNTFSDWQVGGTAGNLVTIGSDTAATHTLVKSGGGTISADYLSISNSAATPTTTWYAGTHSTNNGNNSGWLFTDAPVVLSSSNFFLVF